jgi:hypothetical protein
VGLILQTPRALAYSGTVGLPPGTSVFDKVSMFTGDNHGPSLKGEPGDSVAARSNATLVVALAGTCFAQTPPTSTEALQKHHLRHHGNIPHPGASHSGEGDPRARPGELAELKRVSDVGLGYTSTLRHLCIRSLA